MAEHMCVSSCPNVFCNSLQLSTKHALCKSKVKIRYEPKQTFQLATGCSGHQMLIKRGEVIPVRIRIDGRQKGIEYLREGDIVGLSYLFYVSTEPAVIMVYTKSVLEACLFSTSRIEELIQSCPDLALRIIQQLCRRFRQSINHIEHMGLDNSEERVLYLLNLLGYRGGQVVDRDRSYLTHEELGILAGLNRVTVTRALRGLPNRK